MKFTRETAGWGKMTMQDETSSIWMMLRSYKIAAVCSAALLSSVWTGSEAAAAGERIALILSADEYQVLQRSPVAAERADAIAEALKAQGFETIVSKAPTNATARAKLSDFADRTEAATLAIVVLVGHGVGWSGQPFYLATNSSIGRPTDLLSRAMSLPSIAQIAGRAEAGGVFFFVSAPRFPSPVEGLDVRPQFAGTTPPNTVVVVSTSTSVPVSSMDATSGLVADAFLEAVKAPDATLAGLADAVAGGGRAQVVGEAPDVALAAPPEAPPATAVLPPSPVVETPAPGADPSVLEAERVARENAERSAAQERERADAARLAADQAQAEVMRIQAEAQKAQADAEKAKADAARAQAEAERARAEAEREKALATARPDAPQTTGAVEPIDEKDLGRQQRRVIQQRLTGLSLYTGPIDGIMGPLTREAIMGFQKSRGASVTGYLTPDQFDELIAAGQ